MNKYVVVLFILLLFLSGCTTFEISKTITFNESFPMAYMIGDDVPDFRDSFNYKGTKAIEYEVAYGDLDMDETGFYFVVIHIFEVGNEENELFIEIQIVINDNIL